MTEIPEEMNKKIQICSHYDGMLFMVTNCIMIVPKSHNSKLTQE